MLGCQLSYLLPNIPGKSFKVQSVAQLRLENKDKGVKGQQLWEMKRVSQEQDQEKEVTTDDNYLGNPGKKIRHKPFYLAINVKCIPRRLQYLDSSDLGYNRYYFIP